MLADEEEILIVLPTRRTPAVEEPGRNIFAVVVLTQSRASEILRQMEEVVRLTGRWEGVFKIDCFDAGVFFVPPGCVDDAPPPDSFLILDPATYRTPETVSLVRPQIGIIPGAVTWQAFDEGGRFYVTTIELNEAVLQAAALGGLLQPGYSDNAQKYAFPVSEPMLVKDGKLQEIVM